MSNIVEAIASSAYLGLKRRDQRFVDFYVSGKSAGESLRLSRGLNESKRSTCRVRAHQLLQKAEVQNAIRERTAEAIHDAGAAIVEVMRHQAACATSNVRNLTKPDGTHKSPHELDEVTQMAVRNFEVEEVSTGGRTGTRYRYQFWDKQKAADFIGRAQGYLDAAPVNIDARSVHLHGSGEGVLRAIDDLVARAVTLGPHLAHEAPDPNGSVLPAAVCDGSPGRGAPLDARAHPGSAGES